MVLQILQYKEIRFLRESFFLEQHNFPSFIFLFTILTNI